MSADNDSATAATAAEGCCASCGIAANDDVKKMKSCPHCDLVEYCSDACQQEHREKHEAVCKERAAELYDEILFKQPESSHLGDCPICFLPMPLYTKKHWIQLCCSQRICKGCLHANYLREVKEKLKGHRCPYCRHFWPKTEKEYDKLNIERAKLNDPFALGILGLGYYEKGDYESAFHYHSTAAELGDVQSMFYLSEAYHDGEGVEEDEDKLRAWLEKAAIAGHPEARYNLGVVEVNYNGRVDRAVKHWIIAATLGCDKSIKALKQCYKAGHVSKDDFAAALRAFQAAVNAMKSPQREASAAEGFCGDSE